MTYRKSAATGLALAALAGCATVTSTPDKPRVVASEREQGAKAHPQLLEQFGGAYQGPEAAYVERVGTRIAAAAGLENQCTFTLVNTNVVNAFAVPGCYIYVTRGMMGIINSEAELASVLGHEIGHMTAAHSQRRQNTSLLTGLGSVLVGVLTGSGDLAQAAGQAAQLYTLRYSRGQEYESDDLGIRYLVRAGYDPYEAADMLESLRDHSELEARTRGRDDAKAIPEWASTHPSSAERVTRALAQARATGVAPGALPEQEAAFMTEIDGLLYGDDPAQGFVNGTRFAHPGLRLAFQAPAGFSLTNSPQAVTVEGPNGVRAQFSGGTQAANLDEYAGKVLQGVVGQSSNAVQTGQPIRTQVNGLDTLILPARAQTQQGAVDLTVAAYKIGDRNFHFVALSPAGAADRLDSLFRSVRQLSAAEVKELRPRRFEVVTVKRGDSVRSLASRMAFDDWREERFRMLNDLDGTAEPTVGQRVKLVVWSA